MNERLVFGYGTSGHRGEAPAAGRLPGSGAVRAEAAPAGMHLRGASGRVRSQRDWAFVGLLVFTALLFFRPQDQLPLLNPLHLAELAALGALGVLVAGRLGRGMRVTRLTPELIGVVTLGLVILATAPFSIWMGGAVATFTDLYAKVLLIFVLMVNVLTTPKRIEQFTWVIVVASGYIAARAVFDYARGVNLIENGRVQGAIGGMFKNPNDLALNMVAVLPLATMFALWGRNLSRRLTAGLCGLMMVGTIVASHSRSGAVGLVAMILFLFGAFIRRRPGLVFTGVLIVGLALPFAPDSYWNRVSSIMDESQDDTGSRKAREILLRESFAAFLEHPITGVGAGQFKAYKPEGREEAWRESHNVVLQVAAELGIFGVVVFGFLLVRAALAGRQVRKLLRRLRALPSSSAAALPLADRRDSRPNEVRAPPPHGEGAAVSQAEAEFLLNHSAAMVASLAGWFFCALFASVAYHWTFYYLLALAIAPREILIDRLAAIRASRRAAPAPVAVGARQ